MLRFMRSRAEPLSTTGAREPSKRRRTSSESELPSMISPEVMGRV
jgi:hypothetical protein